MNEMIEYFKEKNLINPLRCIKLIKEAIKFTNLDLKGLSVFTEAASGNFIVTPIIAALAGADKVYAITKDSIYSSKEDVKRDTMLFARLCGVEEKIEVVFDKTKIGYADIVTNLGFVRPIDRKTIDCMNPKAVIPYMCEAWEARKADVDIDYCAAKGIPVIGTNENYKGLDVFNYSGGLAVKMLFDAGIEVYKSKIAIISNDEFGNVLYKTLLSLSSKTILLEELYEENYKYLVDIDALIIANYASRQNIIGDIDAYITAKKLKELSEAVTVIQFAGIVDINSLKEYGINVYPEYEVGSFRMGKTLAYLGPRPVIDLHCAGLKVGEITYRKKAGNFNHSLDDYELLCQSIRSI